MKSTKIIFLIFIILLGIFLFFRNDFLDLWSELSFQLPKIEKLPEFGKEITNLFIQDPEKQISTPSPLFAPKESPQASLTRAGVIRLTNVQREKYGVSLLKENTKLNASAETKAQDMLKNQYFSHYSLSGIGVGNLVESAGYEYIAIGENLALGNFENDEVLVQAWMDSPGHRENILNAQYQEIGVAVVKGIFNGQSTWLAVQHFGLPLSACPQPDKILSTEIEKNQNQIEALRKTLETLQIEIQGMRPKRSSVYNQKIEEYNNLVSEYNGLIQKTKILVEKYNAQAALFNECVSVGE